MPKADPKTSASPPKPAAASCLALTEKFSVSTAFASGTEGRRAALEACEPALKAMTELHLAAACEEIIEWFAANDDVVEFTLSRQGDGDDQGGYWISERLHASFKDGTNSQEYYDHDDDLNGHQLSADRDTLREQADQFFTDLLKRHPLAGTTLIEKQITPSVARALIPSAFKARQEALALASVTRQAPRSKRAGSI